MEYKSLQIKKGITLHCIKTDLFKTNLIAIFVTEKLDKANVTKNALIPAVLNRGTKTMPTQELINKSLEDLYGATFDFGADKTGDNHVLKFYMEALNNDYTITNEDLLEESIGKIMEIIFNPFLENGAFKSEYVEEEKVKLRQLIQSKIDSKDRYSIDRCVEEQYKGELYGLYKFGDVADVDNIDANSLYKRYVDLLNNAKIDIFVSGDFEAETAEKILRENKCIQELPEREPNYVINNETTEVKKKREAREVIETMDVAQGKLVVGFDILEQAPGSRYAAAVYNTILGGSPNSKLFQNIREKNGLAYSIGSVYLRPKNNLFIKAGIEVENYNQAIELLEQQIEDMKNGNFTDEDISNAKKFMSYGIKSIVETQDIGITYYIGQELSGIKVTPEEYLEKINEVTKEDIINIAKKISINTIYFLTNEKGER